MRGKSLAGWQKTGERSNACSNEGTTKSKISHEVRGPNLIFLFSEKNQYMSSKVDHVTEGNLHQTRLQISIASIDIIDDIALVKDRLNSLAWRLHHDLSTEVFDVSVKQIIEHTRTITDIKSMSTEVEKKGSLLVSLETSVNFLKAARKLTNTIITIPDYEVTKAYKQFVKKLEKFQFSNNSGKKLDSLGMIKQLFADDEFCNGVEIIIHLIGISAVKVSVESVVESLVSRYENHYTSSRQMSEDHALEEMTIAENGPLLHHADSLLKRAMNRYWTENTRDGRWHFLRRCEGKSIKIHLGGCRKVVAKQLETKSKLPSLDE